MTTKVIGYVRVSTEKQADQGISPETPPVRLWLLVRPGFLFSFSPQQPCKPVFFFDLLDFSTTFT